MTGLSAFARIAACLVCTLLLLCASSRAGAGGDLKAIQAALEGEEDPKRRRAQIQRLVQHGGAAAATVLGQVVERDADVEVRSAAARGLGRINADNATAILMDRLVDGGPRQVRRAMRQGLAKRTDGRAHLLRRLREARAPELERVLLVATLEAFADEVSLQALFESVDAKSRAVRGAALAALVGRTDHVARRAAKLALKLAKAREDHDVLQLLDVCDRLLHPTMRPAIQRHATSLVPAVRDAATHLLRELDRRKAASAAAKPKDDADPDDPEERYAKPGSRDGDEDPPPTTPPTPRSRFDIVYAIDATGSAQPNVEELRKRIKQEMALLTRSGVSLRVGVVVYRGGYTPSDKQKALEVLSPTFDVRAVHAFIARIKARGVDDRGAAVATALQQALDRTPWRWAAVRVVQLYGDSDVDDPPSATATVRTHFQADRTRTRVAYVLRTRTRVPTAYGDLARHGGTGVVELIE